MKSEIGPSRKPSYPGQKDTVATRILNFMHFDGQLRFPISGSSQISEERMLEQLEKQLRIERAKNILKQGHVLTFSGRIFRFRITANFLSVTDAGFIRVIKNENQLVVDYRLSFWTIFIYCVVMSLIFLAVVISIVPTIKAILFIGGILWASILLSNFLIPLISIRMFLRKVFSDVAEEPSIWSYLYWFS